MKNRIIGLVIFFSLFSGLAAQAKISKKTLAASKTLTAEQILLNQVDTICLYLTTDNIVYVPRLRENRQLSITMTMLNAPYDTQSKDLRDFVKRHIEAFQKALRERLDIYTPELSKEFKMEKDLTVLVQQGVDKWPVAKLEGGEWTWYESQAAVRKGDKVYVPVKPEEMDPKKELCPALVGKTEEEKAAQAEHKKAKAAAKAQEEQEESTSSEQPAEQTSDEETKEEESEKKSDKKPEDQKSAIQNL